MIALLPILLGFLCGFSAAGTFVFGAIGMLSSLTATQPGEFTRWHWFIIALLCLLLCIAAGVGAFIYRHP